MKRLISIMLSLLCIVSAFTIGISSITDAEWAGTEFNLVFQQMNGINMTGGDELSAMLTCLRGFAVSHDGKYMFGGFLNPGGSSSIQMINTSDSTIKASYTHIQSDGQVSYPKGLACDDRGYLYAALAWRQNYGRADFAIIDYNTVDAATGYLKQLSTMQICKTSEALDNTGVKTGVNGITVEEVGGTYYMYVVVNYNVDYLYRFNVTDPSNPVLDTTFGNDGFIDLQKDPYNLTEGNYLDVDTDGLIYMGFLSASDAGMMVLSADGKTVLNKVSQTKGYGVCLYEDYVLVSTQNSGTVNVYNKLTLTPVTTLTIAEGNTKTPHSEVEFTGVYSLCNIIVVNDILYCADQSQNASNYDNVFIAGLTADAKAEVAKRSTAISDHLTALAAETVPVTTAAPTVTTKAPEVTTKAPAATTAAPEATTKAPDVTTTAPNAEGGCGSSLIIAPVASVILLAGYMLGKKKDRNNG